MYILQSIEFTGEFYKTVTTENDIFDYYKTLHNQSFIQLLTPVFNNNGTLTNIMIKDNNPNNYYVTIDDIKNLQKFLINHGIKFDLTLIVIKDSEYSKIIVDHSGKIYKAVGEIVFKNYYALD